MHLFLHFFSLLWTFSLFSLAKTDLQTVSDITAFNAELATWTNDKGATLGGSNSNPRYVLFSLGSAYQYIQKTYTGINDHSYISFTLGMYMESSCNGDVLQLSFDNIQTQALKATGLAASPTGMFFIKGGVPHSGSSLTVTITRKLGGSCGSFRFGLRELNMNFMKNLQSTEQPICQTHPSYPQLSPQCNCGPSLIEAFPCASCSMGCLKCGKVLSGVETCSKCDSTKSLEWDGETCSTCGSHCDKCGTKMGADCRSCLDTHFIYGNGTCNEGCASPFKQVSTGNLVGFCVAPCEKNEWLYADLSCKSYCPSYSVKETDENRIRWCRSPCEDGDYYSEEKGTCEGACEYPNKPGNIGGIKTCSLNLDEEETKQIKGISKGVNGINSGSSGAIFALSFLSSSDSSSIFMGAFSKMLQYIKYMDILYPAKVELMLEMLNSNSSSTGGLASRIMRKELNKFPKRELPEKFEYYESKSSFFVNYWPSLFILLILLTVTMLLILVSSYLKPSGKTHQVLAQVISQLKWNMILLLFCGDIGDIMFFTALEVITADPDTLESSLSLITCIIINLLALWVMVKILTVNFNIRKERIKMPGNKWENFKTFFAIYKDQSYFQQIFLFIFIIRVSIFNAVIGYFFKYPLAQAILITLTNLAMLLYLIFKRPMKALINFIQQIVLEGFLFVFNICLCILAGLDHNEIEAYDFRDGVGEVMVVINLVVPIISIGLLAVKISILGIEAYKEWKAEKAKQKDLDKRDIRIELPHRKQRGGKTSEDQMAKKNGELEMSITNKSNILDISSSNASFLNSSQPWIHPNGDESRKKAECGSQFGTFDYSSGSSQFQQPARASPVLSCEIEPADDIQGSPARKILKRPKIKRNRTLKFNQSQVMNGEMESVFGVAE